MEAYKNGESAQDIKHRNKKFCGHPFQRDIARIQYQIQSVCNFTISTDQARQETVACSVSCCQHCSASQHCPQLSPDTRHNIRYCNWALYLSSSSSRPRSAACSRVVTHDAAASVHKQRMGAFPATSTGAAFSLYC